MYDIQMVFIYDIRGLQTELEIAHKEKNNW